jgi:hypothetical protein
MRTYLTETLLGYDAGDGILGWLYAFFMEILNALASLFPFAF